MHEFCPRVGRFGRFLPAVLVLSLFVVSEPLAAEESEDAIQKTPISLAEALQLTAAHHPLMGAARQELEVFKAKLFAADWAWLPKVKSKGYASAAPGKEGDALNGSTVYDEWGPYLSFEISGLLPVYTFGKIRNLQRMAEYGVRAGKAQLQIARAKLEELVLQAYLGLQLTTEMLAALDDGMQYMQRARNYLEEKRDRDAEDYDDVDMLKLKVYESELEGRRLEALRTQRLSLRGLELLTGRGKTQFLPPTSLKRYKFKLKDQKHYVDLAMTNRGEMLALKAALGAQDRRVALEKSQFYPDLFVGAFFKVAKAWAVEQQSSPFAYDPYNSWFAGAGLGFEWRFDLATRISGLDEQKAKKRKLASQTKVVRQQIELEVYESWLKVDEMKSRYKLDKRAYKAARGWMLAKLDLYESGFAGFEDLKDGLVEFFKRKMLLEQSVYEYNMAVAKLAMACGMPAAAFLGIE